MKAYIISFLAVCLGLTNGSVIPEDGLKLKARDEPYPKAQSTSTTSTTVTYTSTTSTTGTEYDTLTTTCYVTPTCSGTITWVTTVVAPPSKTYTVGTTYFYENVSYMYYVSGVSTYSTTSAIYSSQTYVPGQPGPGPKTATAPTTARQLNTLPSPCVAIIETKTLTYEPEVQTQVYLKNTVATTFAWTAITGTKTVELVATESGEVTVNVFTGVTRTLPYTQPSLVTIPVTDAPPSEAATTVAPEPTSESQVATTAVPVATGAAASNSMGGFGVALVVGVGVVLGL